MSTVFEKREYLDEELNLKLENDKFYEYYQFLISENEKYNLTRITELNDVYYKHFYDSIYLSKLINLTDKQTDKRTE